MKAQKRARTSAAQPEQKNRVSVTLAKSRVVAISVIVQALAAMASLTAIFFLKK
jgi:hypothetical protein